VPLANEGAHSGTIPAFRGTDLAGDSGEFGGQTTTSRRVNFDDNSAASRHLCNCVTINSPPPYYFKLSREVAPPVTAGIGSSTASAGSKLTLDRSPLIVGRPSPAALTSEKQRHTDVIGPTNQCREQFK